MDKLPDKIVPECGYFNEEKDSEYAPYSEKCEDCYRYEICAKIYIKENEPEVLYPNCAFFDIEDPKKINCKDQCNLYESCIKLYTDEKFEEYRRTTSMDAYDIYKENIRVQKYKEAFDARNKLIKMLDEVTLIYNSYELVFKDKFMDIIFGDFRSKDFYRHLEYFRDYGKIVNSKKLFEIIKSNGVSIGRTSEDSYITESEHKAYFYFDINKAILKAIMEEIEAHIKKIDDYITWVLNASRKDLKYQIHDRQENQDEFDSSLFEHPVFEDIKAIHPSKNSNMDFIEQCIEEKNYTNLAEFLCMNKDKFDYDNLASAVGNISHWLKQDKQ